jgi:hypothetical protein
MKALKSSRAKAVLADPKAKAQLRDFLASKSAGVYRAASSEHFIEMQSEGRTVRIMPRVVAKAA